MRFFWYREAGAVLKRINAWRSRPCRISVGSCYPWSFFLILLTWVNARVNFLLWVETSSSIEERTANVLSKNSLTHWTRKKPKKYYGFWDSFRNSTRSRLNISRSSLDLKKYGNAGCAYIRSLIESSVFFLRATLLFWPTAIQKSPRKPRPNR